MTVTLPYRHALPQILLIFGCFSTIVRTLHAQEEQNLALKMANSYTRESKEFFLKNRSEEEKQAFWLAWRDKLLDAARQYPRTQGAYRALSQAEMLSNTIRDYPTSILILETLLDHYPEKQRYWIVELAGVSMSAWLKTRNPAYGRKSFETLRTALQGNKIDKDSRMLLASWMGSRIDYDFTTPEDVPVALEYINEAIKEFENGYQPQGRAIPAGVNYPGLLEIAIKLSILDHRYQESAIWIERFKSLTDQSRPSGLVLSIVDSHKKLRFRDDNELRDYVAFLDTWIAKNPDDPKAIKIRLIPARRYFYRKNLEEAKARFEEIVNNHQPEIEALDKPDHFRAYIWTFLYDIYVNLGDDERIIEAAKKSMEAKSRANLPTEGEESVLNMARKREKAYRNVHQHAQEKTHHYRMVIIINGLLLSALIAIGLYRMFRRNR